MYKFDRSAFKASTAEEADHDMRNYKTYTWKKRLKIAMYLNSIAFDFPVNDPPKVDRQIFQAISRK